MKKILKKIKKIEKIKKFDKRAMEEAVGKIILYVIILIIILLGISYLIKQWLV